MPATDADAATSCRAAFGCRVRYAQGDVEASTPGGVAGIRVGQPGRASWPTQGGAPSGVFRFRHAGDGCGGTCGPAVLVSAVSGGEGRESNSKRVSL